MIILKNKEYFEIKIKKNFSNLWNLHWLIKNLDSFPKLDPKNKEFHKKNENFNFITCRYSRKVRILSNEISFFAGK